jgi:hypothetical protein
MRTSTITMLHDTGMMLIIVALGSWRFTGVPWHEYLSIALAAAVFVHLVRQRSWIAANALRLGSLTTWRARVNVVLNVLMFLTLVSVTASGLFASKVVWPHPDMAVDAFVRWHDIHGYTGTWLQWLAALHIAVNWTPLLKRFRVVLGTRGSPAPRRPWFPENLGRVALFGAWVLVASAMITAVTMGAQRLMPTPARMLIDRADGRGEQPATRAEIVGLRPGQEFPHSDGFRRFAMGLLATAAVAAVGRGVLRLRL